jgi:hypothetical protein
MIRIVREAFWFWDIRWTVSALYIAVMWLISWFSKPEFRAWFGWPSWWLEIVDEPEALGSFLGTAVGGLFVAVAAGIGFWGVKHSTMTEDRRQREAQERRAHSVSAALEGDLLNLASVYETLAKNIVRTDDFGDAKLAPAALQSLQGDRIFDQFVDRLGEVHPEILPYLLNVYQTRGIRIEEIKFANAMEEGPGRNDMFGKVGLKLIYAGLFARSVAENLKAARQQYDILDFAAADIRESAVQARLVELRAKNDDDDVE